jgi:hypothetical protein
MNMAGKCLLIHDWEEVYYGDRIAIGCEKRNKEEQILKGKWHVLRCKDCGEIDIPDIRRTGEVCRQTH